MAKARRTDEQRLADLQAKIDRRKQAATIRARIEADRKALAALRKKK